MTADDTRPSMLRRVRDVEDGAAWNEFDARYRGLILGYCRRRGLQDADAEDVRQLVMLKLARALDAFEYDPDRGRFRNYLLRVVANAMHGHFARRGRDERRLETGDANQLSAPADDLDELWLEEWRSHHYRLALEAIRRHHEPRTMQVFEEVVGGRVVADVASAHGLSAAAVYKIKHRLRDELSERIAEQVDDEDRGRDRRD